MVDNNQKGKKDISPAQALKLRQERAEKKKKYIVIGVVALIVIVIIFGIAAENAPRNYYLKDIKVASTQISEKVTEDNKYYVRVKTLNFKGGTSTSTDTKSEAVVSLGDDTWVEVTSEYYSKHNTMDNIGVLVNNCDVFKKKYGGIFGDNGQTFEKNIYQVEDVYDTYDDAIAANECKKRTEIMPLVKKKTTQKGDKFFVFDINGAKMSVPVNSEIYDKYNINDKIKCDIESIKDFTRIVKVE